MSEIKLVIEGDRSFIAHFGTTLENFLTCAVEKDGRIYFDKSRESRHDFPEIQFVHGLNGGAEYARDRAKELGHTPAVLEGKLDSSFSSKQSLPDNTPLPVESVWIPREGSQWDVYLMHDEKMLHEVYKKNDPRKLLNKLKSEQKAA